MDNEQILQVQFLPLFPGVLFACWERMTNHDRLSKELLRQFFLEFLQLFFPKMAAAIDPASLAFLDKELFTGPPANERFESDLVARARFFGIEAYFIILAEAHEQGQFDFNERMFWYFALLIHRHKLPVYPIALLSYHSSRTAIGNYRVAFPDLQVLDFNFRVIQLKKLNWRDFLRNPNPVAAALMTKMGMTPEERPRVKLECLRMLVRLRLDRDKSRFISGFIDTYLRLSAEETLIFERETDTLLESGEKETIMELTTSWKEEGIEQGNSQGIIQGISQGIDQGRKEESERMILRQLGRRFGFIPPALISKLKSLSVEQLENLGEALLDFRSLEDLENWLGQ